MTKNNYEVQILVNGKPVKEYFHKGKVYIEGKQNTDFSIRIKNNSWSRKLFIPTIDGLSVINGKKASYYSPGYIVDGYSSLTIDGWRASDEKIRQFYFSSPENSYAGKTDSKENIGIIGVAVFEEKQYKHTYDFTITSSYPNIPIPKYAPSFTSELWRYNTLSSPIQCSATSQEIGTGVGEEKQNSVIKVSFDSEDKPVTVFKIFYNTRKQLENIGIDFKKRPQYITQRAFPNEYCQFPK